MLSLKIYVWTIYNQQAGKIMSSSEEILTYCNMLNVLLTLSTFYLFGLNLIIMFCILMNSWRVKPYNIRSKTCVNKYTNEK